MSPLILKIMNKELDEMLKLGVEEPSQYLEQSIPFSEKNVR